MKLFGEYLLIGGMPEVVQQYVETNDYYDLSVIYQSLLNSYLDDVEKYSRTKNEANNISEVLRRSFIQAGMRINFENFAETMLRFRETKDALRTLEKAMLLRLVYPTTSVKPPSLLDVKKSPKLFLLDVGLVNYFAGLQKEIILSDKIEHIYKGRIAEQIVWQTLVANTKSIFHLPSFWIRDKSGSLAEVDFIYNFQGMLIPIEVKAGKAGRLRSLMQLIDISLHNFAVRIYSGKLSVEETKTIKGKKFRLLNLPFFLVERLNEYLNWFINGKNSLLE